MALDKLVTYVETHSDFPSSSLVSSPIALERRSTEL